jgi:hypothetical protein
MKAIAPGSRLPDVKAARLDLGRFDIVLAARSGSRSQSQRSPPPDAVDGVGSDLSKAAAESGGPWTQDISLPVEWCPDRAKNLIGQGQSIRILSESEFKILLEEGNS